MLTEIQQAEFESRLNAWLEGAQKLVTAHTRFYFPNVTPGTLELKRGKRYILVTRRDGSSGSAHAFIDTTNGDVLKPASYKVPAKHARGNLFDAKGGLGSMGPYGPAYLR